MRADLVVKVTCGAEEPERCAQAFTVAATAVASGVDGVAVAHRRGVVVRAAGTGGRLALGARRRWPSCWTRCWPAGRVTRVHPVRGRRGITADDLLPGVRIAGAATFVAEVTADDAQALVY